MPRWPGAGGVATCQLLLPLLLQLSALGVNGQGSQSDWRVSNFAELEAAAEEIQQLWRSDASSSANVTVRLSGGIFMVPHTVEWLTAPSSGGYIHIVGAGQRDTVMQCESNSTSAMSFSAAMDIRISAIQFKSCGQAVSVDLIDNPYSVNASVTVDGCTFEANVHSKAAAARFALAHSVVVQDCVFRSNWGYGVNAAGALYLDHIPDSTIINCSFTDHYVGDESHAQLAFNGQHQSACIYFNSGVIARVQDSVFSDNYAAGLWYSSGAITFNYTTFPVLVNTNFSNNKAAGVVGVGSVWTDSATDINMTGCHFINSSAPLDYGTGAFRAEYFLHMSMSHSSFYHCSCQGANGWGAMAVLTFVPNSHVDMYEVSFVNNTDSGYAGIPAFMLGGITTANMTRVTCINNSAPSDLGRGAIVLYQVSYAYMFESYLGYNTGYCSPNNQRTMHPGASSSDLPTVDYFKCGGGAVFVFTSKAVFVNTLFEHNGIMSEWSAGGAIFAHSSPSLNVINCTFRENMAGAGGAIGAIANSVIMIDMPLFDPRATKCSLDPLAALLKGSWPRLWDIFNASDGWGSKFEVNYAIAGGAISILDSSLSISFMPQLKCTVVKAHKVLFKENRAMSGGAIASLRAAGSFFIMHTQFVNNSAYAEAINWKELTKEYLRPGMEITVNIPTAMALAVSCGCGAGNGGGVCFSTTGMYQGSNQVIATSSFTDNHATYGGALYVTADEVNCPDPDSCNLLLLTGLQQCPDDFVALYSSGPGNIMVEGTTLIIENNTAVSGAGGGIYYEHVNIAHAVCEQQTGSPQSRNLSRCVEDYSIEQRNPSCDEWRGNRAIDGAYGARVASSPVTYSAELVNPAQQSSYTSGDPLPLLLIIYDMFGQEHTVAAPNQAGSADVLFTVIAMNKSSQQMYKEINVRATPYRLPPEMSTISFESQPGVVSLDVYATIELVRRDIGEKVINVTVRRCKIGEFSAKGGTLCLMCDVGRYNLDPEANLCNSCPEGATCIIDTAKGEATVNPIIMPDINLFNSNPFSNQVFQCPNSETCDFEGREEQLLAYQYALSLQDPWLPSVRAAYNASYYYSLQCAEGYTGPVCALCDTGWGQSGPAECVQCTTAPFVTSILTFLVNCLSVIPLLLSMNSAMENANKYISLKKSKIYMSQKKTQIATEAVCLKTIVSYFQVIGMFKWVQFTNVAMIQINVDMNVIDATQSVAERIVYATQSIVSMKCTQGGDMGLHPSSAAMIVSFAIPLAGFTLLCVVWGFMDFWGKLFGKLFGTLFPVKEEEAACVVKIDSYTIQRNTEPALDEALIEEEGEGGGGAGGGEGEKQLSSSILHKMSGPLRHIGANLIMRQEAKSRGASSNGAISSNGMLTEAHSPGFAHTHALSPKHAPRNQATPPAYGATSGLGLAPYGAPSILRVAEALECGGGGGDAGGDGQYQNGGGGGGLYPYVGMQPSEVASAWERRTSSESGVACTTNAGKPPHNMAMNRSSNGAALMYPGSNGEEFRAQCKSSSMGHRGSSLNRGHSHVASTQSEKLMSLGRPPLHVVDENEAQTHAQTQADAARSSKAGAAPSSTRDRGSAGGLSMGSRMRDRTSADREFEANEYEAEEELAPVDLDQILMERAGVPARTSACSDGSDPVVGGHVVDLNSINKKEEGWSMHKFTSVVIVAFIVSTFYYYSNIVQQTILIFMCYTLDDEATAEPLAVYYGLSTGSRWIMNYDATCWEGEHLFLVFFLGIPGILFSVGMPILWAFWLMRNQWHLEEADFKARYAFMYEDYRAEYYAYGSVEMIRKLALMSILVLLSDEKNPPGVQLLSAVTVAVAMLLLHVTLQPNLSPIIHKLELLSELTIVFTLQYMIYFTYPVVPSGYAAFTLIIGAFNILTLAIMAGSWVQLIIENMIMEAGMDDTKVHMMSPNEFMEAKWPDMKNRLGRKFFLRNFIAGPIIIWYKIGHWFNKQYQKVAHRVQVLIHGPKGSFLM